MTRYRHRSRLARRIRRTWRRMSGGQRLAVLAVAVVFFAGAGHAAAAAHRTAATPAPSGAAAAVIAYARAQLNCPYAWGGTGPCQSGYDCSGLAMQAYAAAGISIPRTSQEQWAAGPQVADPQPGDLVYFAGADGTWASPGHVGIVVDPATHTMIDAYATGLPVEYDTYGLPTSAPGLGDPVGFTDPLRGS